MTQRLDRVEYKNGNQKRDCQTRVEDFQVSPQEVMHIASIDTLDAAHDAGYSEGIRDVLNHPDVRVCGRCGKIVFETNFLGYCGRCAARIVEVAIRYLLPWLVIGLILWLTR